jgi:uncharacterized surface protein with fasciclin (FAS1) repeats
MFPSKTIVANTLNSADHTTLVAAVKAAGPVDTLNGPGPFTVFAPTNVAFAMLPAGAVETLVRPENREGRGGDIADITISDVRQSNGVIQVVDHVRRYGCSPAVL